MLCSNCKAPLNPETKFCAKCGQKTNKGEAQKNNTHSNSAQSNQSPNAPQQKSSGSMSGKLFLLLGVAALLAGGYGINQLYQSKNSSEQDLIAEADPSEITNANATDASAKTQGDHIESPNAAELKAVVEEQLKALQAGDIEKAYNDYVSKEFREATSLDAFQQFVKSLPVLTSHSSYSFIETSEEGGKGFVLVSLLKEQGKEVLIEYTLTQEDGKWKVQGFRVDQFEETEQESSNPARADQSKENTPSTNEEKPKSDTTLLENHPEIKQAIATIEGQLNALREHDVTKAYQEYTTKEFQQATTLQQYQDAIKDYPLLSQNTDVNYDYDHTTLDRDHVTIPVILKKGNETLLLDVALVKMGNDWKIWGTEVKEAPAMLADTATANEAKVDRTQDKKDVTAVVEAQLKLLQENNIKKAYDDYVSTDFQQATPYQAFEDFIKQYPILASYKTVTLGDISFEGDKASVVAILQTPDSSNPIEYSLIKVGNQWKVYGFRLLVADQTQLSNTDKGEIIALITDQHAALKSNDLEKTYGLTAKEFQQATPLAAFEDFIKNYPIFQKFTSTSFSNATIDHNSVMMVVTLNSPEQSTDVEYRLAKEDNQWKIWSMSVVRNTNTAARPSSINSTEFVTVIQNQLDAIRKQNYKQAYDEDTSKGFKETTTPQNFEQFVHKNPVLSKNKTFNLTNFNYENDIGSVEGTLTSEDGETEPVKYRLVYEDKDWKILSINILYALRSNSKELQISKVDIGTEVDQRGLVTHPSTTLQPGKDKITANVHVLNATKGTSIEAVLEHVESGSKVAPVKTVLDRDGNSIVSFAFSAPSQGWPKGHYKLHISTSTGVEQDAEFTVD